MPEKAYTVFPFSFLTHFAVGCEIEESPINLDVGTASGRKIGANRANNRQEHREGRHPSMWRATRTLQQETKVRNKS